MKPLFKVGEKAIIQPLVRKEFSGAVCVILEVIERNRYISDSGGIYEGYAYITSVAPPSGLWAESALKKHQEPSELSFERIVSQVKTKVKS